MAKMPSDHNIKLPDYHIFDALTGTFKYQKYSFIDLQIHFNVSHHAYNPSAIYIRSVDNPQACHRRHNFDHVKYTINLDR